MQQPDNQQPTAAVKAQNMVMARRIAGLESDSSSLQRYLSILQGDEGMEWVSSRTVPAACEEDEYTYTGQMRRGMSHGFGRASWARALESYDGQWEEGKRQGQGIYQYSDGDIYVGQWEDGKRHGQGVYKWSNGDSEQGRYAEGRQQGTFSRTEVGDCSDSRYMYHNNRRNYTVYTH
jgi:hypothetical protein